MKKVAKLIPVDGLVAKDGQAVVLNIKGDDYVQVFMDGKNIGYLAKTLSSASKFATAKEIASLIENKTPGTINKNGRTWTITVNVKDDKSVYYLVGGGNKAVFPAKPAPNKELNQAIKEIKQKADEARAAANAASTSKAANAAKLEAEAAAAEQAVAKIGRMGIVHLDVVDSGNNIIFMYKGTACCTPLKAEDGAFMEAKKACQKNGIDVLDAKSFREVCPNLEGVECNIAAQLENYSWLIQVSVPNGEVVSAPVSGLDIDDLLDGLPENDKSEIEVRLSWLNKVAPNLADDVISKFLNRISSHKNITPFKPTFVDNKENYVERCVSGIVLGMNLRLVGPAGCGKNRLVDTLQNLFDVGISDMAFNADTNQDSLLGVPTVTTNKDCTNPELVNSLFSQVMSIFKDKQSLIGKSSAEQAKLIEDAVDGNVDWMPLIDALKSDTAVIKFQLSDMMEKAMKPSLLNFDEVNMAPGYITALLHPMTDHRRYINIPGYGMLKLNDEAFVVCTMNEEYEGTKTLNRAFRDRFLTIRFKPSQSISQILRNEVPRLDAASAKQMDEIYKKIQSSIPATINEESLSLRSFIRAANLRVSGWTVKKALEVAVVEDVDDADDREAIRTFVDIMIK